MLKTTTPDLTNPTKELDDITDDRTRTNARFTSNLFLAGAALLIFANTAHPVDSDPSATSRLDLAAGPMWIIVHLAIAMGVILVVGGFTALRGLLTDPRAESYARFGAATALIGGTMLVIVFGALDGYGISSLASEWDTVSGADRETIRAAAIALDATDSGMTALGIVALFGLTIAGFGRAILASRIVTAWLGWVALAIGAAGLITGVTFLVEGPTTFTINVLFRPVALAATVYFIALGVALRKLHPAASRPRLATAGGSRTVEQANAATGSASI